MKQRNFHHLATSVVLACTVWPIGDLFYTELSFHYVLVLMALGVLLGRGYSDDKVLIATHTTCIVRIRSALTKLSCKCSWNDVSIMAGQLTKISQLLTSFVQTCYMFHLLTATSRFCRQ